MSVTTADRLARLVQSSNWPWFQTPASLPGCCPARAADQPPERPPDTAKAAPSDPAPELPPGPARAIGFPVSRNSDFYLPDLTTETVVHARAITFQLAEVAVTGPMVRAILAAIRRLGAPTLCA